MLSKCITSAYSLSRTFSRSSSLFKQTNHRCSNIYQFSNRFNSQNVRGPSPSPPKPSPRPKMQADTKQSIAYYSMAAVALCAGLTYAAVPLYRLFCQSTGYGGTVNENHDASKVEKMKPVKDRVIKIQFNADLSASMRWNFKPQQYEIRVRILSF